MINVNLLSQPLIVAVMSLLTNLKNFYFVLLPLNVISNQIYTFPWPFHFCLSYNQFNSVVMCQEGDFIF